MKKTGLSLGCAALLGWMGWAEPVAETPAKWDLETKSGRRSVTVLAARSADGARKTLLVTDYRGTETTFEVSVKGVPAGVKPRVQRLDHGHADWEEVPSFWDGGKLTLKKESPGSAAFLVDFAAQGDGK